MTKKGKKFYKIAKRFIDLVGSLFLLILFSPVLIASAIAIKLTSKGPVFADTPKRVGLGGKPFYAFKFRSMIAGAHQLQYKDPKYKKF